MILSVFRGGNWRKTAAVVSRVTRECEDRRMAVSFGEVFERVLAMVDSGSLEAAGDLSLLRYSELRPSQAE